MDEFGDTVTLPAFRPRMVCTSCGIVGADARPNWQEREGRESLTGAQWSPYRLKNDFLIASIEFEGVCAPLPLSARKLSARKPHGSGCVIFPVLLSKNHSRHFLLSSG